MPASDFEGDIIAFGQVSVPGDIDGDGIVDVTDLALVRNNFGPSDAGDADGDGQTDANDLALEPVA